MGSEDHDRELERLRAENEKLREALGKQAEKHIRLIELMQEKETLHDPYEDGINAGLRFAVNIIKESVESDNGSV